MNILNSIIEQSFPNTELSCRQCGGKHITAQECSGVTMMNPLGEKELVISCESCELVDEAVKPEDVRHIVKKWLVQSVRSYTCTFIFEGGTFKTSSDGGLADFSEGFWVNKPNLLFTKGSDAAYWVPPGKIEHVAVETKTKRLSE